MSSISGQHATDRAAALEIVKARRFAPLALPRGYGLDAPSAPPGGAHACSPGSHRVIERGHACDNVSAYSPARQPLTATLLRFRIRRIPKCRRTMV